MVLSSLKRLEETKKQNEQNISAPPSREPDLRLRWTGSTRDGWELRHGPCHRRAFAEAEAAVVIADINETTLGTATDELRAAGHRVLGVRCDVSDEDSVAAMVKATVDTFDRLDMAFNNAGIIVPPSGAADEPAEIFDRVTAINLRGVWACMKHELGQMRAEGSGAIVNCSSIAGLVGGPGRPSYTASKHGVIGLTTSAAMEYAPAGSASTLSAPAARASTSGC